MGLNPDDAGAGPDLAVARAAVVDPVPCLLSDMFFFPSNAACADAMQETSRRVCLFPASTRISLVAAPAKERKKRQIVFLMKPTKDHAAS
jgi:hypothetical protein